MKNFSSKKSFTLIELLVVIAIVGILAGIIIVSMTNATDNARIAKAKSFYSSTDHVLGVNPIAEWTFDNITDYNSSTMAVGTASNNIPDSVGSFHGTASSGIVLKEGSDCIFGKCLFFNGSSNIVVGNYPELDITNQKTFSFWVKPSVLDTYRGVLSKQRYSSSSVNEGYYIRFFSNKTLRFATQQNGSFGGVDSDICSTDRWYFFVVAFDNGTITMYIDGSSIKKITGQPYPAATNETFKIASVYNAAEYFIGYIDDIKIYNGVLPNSQIKTNYLAGLDSLLLNGSISKKEYEQRIATINNYYLVKK